MTASCRAALCATVACLVVVSVASAARTRTLVPDPAGLLDLPAGFSYRVVARAGDEMDDGLSVPALPDGMGAFAGPDGATIVVCNHECTYPRHGAFGVDGAGLARVYDRGDGTLPPGGGTTTFVWDTRSQTLVRQYLSLAGTVFNCSGGTTPWGTWLSCEEKTYRAGWSDGAALRLQRDHGYVFEVPARSDGGLAEPEPLVALGRFTHESIACDERTDVLYQTEDLHDGLFYRFVPTLKRDLRAGGRLQALGLHDRVRDARNHAGDGSRIRVGDRLKVRWIDMDRVDAPDDDLRIRGYDLGACRFDRGEGMCMTGGVVYFACTFGGPARAGQVWRYEPSPREGRTEEKRSPGTLELYYEVADTTQILNPDNITAMPTGDLLICEDPEHGSLARLIIMTRRRDVYTLASSRVPGELTGAVFSPDESTLFVNMQKAGVTLAITGPWKEQ